MPLLPDLDQLSLEQQVAQMVVVRAAGHLFDHQIQYPAWEPTADRLRGWLDLGVGGVILLGGSAAEIALRSQQLQEWAAIPLLLAADIEEGVGQRFAGATWFPPPMALAALAETDPGTAEDYAADIGAATAQEALAIGLNWVLAPVVDVNNNPQNPVINVRAFGETPERVSQLATAFIRGAQRHPVLTTAKHFPGHGDTATDSHLDLPVLAHTEERLRQIELPSFAAAIAAGVDGIMSAHLKIPVWDARYPATLSQRILTGELRQRLGFEGLIVTDALVMGAIANQYGTEEAAVLAVEAGADILLMPLDPSAAIAAVCEAVEAGRISPERIRASVGRIWQAKYKICAPRLTASGSEHAWETVPPPPIQLEELAQPQVRANAADLLHKSLQVGPQRLSVSESRGSRNLIVVDSWLDCDFLNRQAPAIAIPRSLGYTLQLVDSHAPSPDWNASAAPTLLQLFIRGNPFRGSAGLTETAHAWFQHLLQSGKLQALVIYGSPYVLEQFLPQLPETCPYAFSYGQMPTAQAIALNALLERPLTHLH